MKKTIQQIGFDPETLKMWKNSSVRAKLEWLECALEFGVAMKNPKVDEFLESRKKR